MKNTTMEQRLSAQMWSDIALRQFNDEKAFVQFLGERDEKTHWFETKLANIKFIAANQEDPLSQICEANKLGIDQEMYAELLVNSGMFLSIKRGFLPFHVEGKTSMKKRNKSLRIMIMADSSEAWAGETVTYTVSIENDNDESVPLSLKRFIRGKGKITLISTGNVEDNGNGCVTAIVGGKSKIEFNLQYKVSEKDMREDVYPIGLAATKKILEYSGIRGERYAFLHERNITLLASIINQMVEELARVRDSRCKVKIDEMVRTIVSDRYAIVPCSELIEKTVDFYLPDNFPEAKFMKGFWCHDMVSATWDLSAYADRFADVMAKFDCAKVAGYIPALTVVSSDVTKNAITLYPTLAERDAGAHIPLLMGTHTQHIGVGTIYERLNADFAMVLSNFTEAVVQLASLDSVKIKYGRNTLIRCMKLKKVSMPVDQAREAVENFPYDGECTALDVYLAIVQAYNFVCRDFPADKARCFRTYDSTVSAMRTNWSLLDRPEKVEM